MTGFIETRETSERREDEAHHEDDGFKELASETRQFVTFITGGEVFAVDMAPVQEIIRLPKVVRVPLAPATLEGLANLRGKVLPIISLRRMFGFPEQEPDDATRAVVVDVGQPLGFVVDRVASVVGVEPSQIEDVGAIRSTVDTDLLSGLIKGVGGHAMIMVLDFEKLIAREFSQIAGVSKGAGMAGALSASAADDDEEEAANDELQLVSFNVAEQEYAIAIEDVQEIVQIPDTIIHVPHSESHVIGVMTLRSRLLPLVSLRRMFGLPDQPLDEKSRIVVLALGGTSVGVVVDGVSEVLRVAKTFVDAMPPLLAKEGELAEISEICRLDGGKRLVSIITVRNLFDHSAIKEALNTVNDIKREADDDTAELDEDLDDDEQVVVFRLGKEEFGVPINSVQEIVRVPEELIHVPRAPAFVEGVINLRGSVLPVIDLRLRLGLSRVERSDNQRIMVFLIADVRTGFIVDQVAEVLKIPKSVIEPAPKLSSGQGRLLSRMANMEKQKRMVQLLEPAYLVEGEELTTLAAVGGEAVIKLLIVDDSALMRRQLTQIFASAGDFEIGQARNGREAVEQNRVFQPDVVTLDINMPEMDGLTALSLIMVERPVAVVMVSSLTEQGALATFEALNLGAVDYIVKPGGTISLSIDEIKDDLVGKVRAAARARVKGKGSAVKGLAQRMRDDREKVAVRPMAVRCGIAGEGLVIVGVSTGGPRTLAEILPQLPADFPWPVLVAQHMPAAFTKSFAERLNQACALRVVEAASPMPVEPGTVYIAKGSADMVVAMRAGKLIVLPKPENSQHLWHPSAELLGRSVLEHCDPARVTGVMLTGMGSDGVDAFTEIKQRGGRTIAESEESCVVFGMPKELIEKRGASLVLASEKIASQLNVWAGR